MGRRSRRRRLSVPGLAGSSRAPPLLAALALLASCATSLEQVQRLAAAGRVEEACRRAASARGDPRLPEIRRALGAAVARQWAGTRLALHVLTPREIADLSVDAEAPDVVEERARIATQGLARHGKPASIVRVDVLPGGRPWTYAGRPGGEASSMTDESLTLFLPSLARTSQPPGALCPLRFIGLEGCPHAPGGSQLPSWLSEFDADRFFHGLERGMRLFLLPLTSSVALGEAAMQTATAPLAVARLKVPSLPKVPQPSELIDRTAGPPSPHAAPAGPAPTAAEAGPCREKFLPRPCELDRVDFGKIDNVLRGQEYLFVVEADEAASGVDRLVLRVERSLNSDVPCEFDPQELTLPLPARQGKTLAEALDGLTVEVDGSPDGWKDLAPER